jgi:hypothetical protein
MPTIQQIIDYADRKFENSVSDANKILDLDDIHTRLFVKIQRLKHDVEFEDMDTTIADQATYSLPTKCHIENIVTDGISVSQSVTITTSTEWDKFTYAGLNDDIESGNYFMNAGNGDIAIFKDGEPLQTTGLTIRVFFYKRPTALTSVSQVPELDTDYHDLLKYKLIQMIASEGHSPNQEIANYWENEYQEYLKEVMDDLSSKYTNTPGESLNVCNEYW